MHVNFTPDLESFIRQKVNAGQYSSTADVIRDAVRRMLAEEARAGHASAEPERRLQTA